MDPKNHSLVWKRTLLSTMGIFVVHVNFGENPNIYMYIYIIYLYCVIFSPRKNAMRKGNRFTTATF